MGYTLNNSSPVYPAQVSYQKITLTGNIVVTWPFSFASGTIIARLNDVTTSADGYTITLPDATLASVGQDILFNNVSGHSFEVYANDGTTLLATITSGQILYFYLYDNVTSPASNGLWRIIPFGEGASSITTFTAESTDSTITITDGTVTAPTGTINFQLPTSISNLNNVATTGIATITGDSPLTWLTRHIVAGNNIVVSDGDGLNGNPTIALSATVSGLTSMSVGNFHITGSGISAITTNSSLTIASNGTGNLSINGVIIDAAGDISTAGNVVIGGNVVIDGSFSNPLVPVAWVTFTDTGSAIVIQDSSNVTSVTRIGSGGGQYTITFTDIMSDHNYGVLVGTGTAIIADLPSVSQGFSKYSAQTTSTCEIAVVDASGQYVSQALSGITVQILSSN